MFYKQELLVGEQIELDSQLLETFQEEVSSGRYPQLSTVAESSDLGSLQKVADEFKQRFESIIVLGTGGSSLGAQAICSLRYVGLGFPQPKPALYFMDNIDPDTFKDLLTSLDLKKTGVIAVSKSGTTAETVFQLLYLIDQLKAVVTEDNLKDHIVLLTEPKNSPFTRIGHDYGFRTLDHHPGIGGRFSAFSNVAALPALIAGIDFKKVREGAQSVLNNPKLPCLGGQAIDHLYKGKHITNTVLMPYIDRLFLFAGWFRQLWAESLGKEGKGLTPIRALGTVDQHSQTQLYLDGPKDKFFTFILSKPKGKGAQVTYPDPELAYLNGQSMGDLLDSEQRATVMSLYEKGCPLRVIQFDSLNEGVMGALMMHYMIETILTAKLMGVDAFNQPAVERGKVLTREYLKAG